MIQNNSKGQLTAQVDLGKVPRSGFRFDYPYRGSGRIGRIYNTRSQRVYPSDDITSNSQAALQFEPLAVPILANMYVHQEHFYVPENTLWEDFDKFISGGVKMDYQGKKPSMSLQNMFRAFFDYLTNQQEGYFIGTYITKETNTEFYINQYAINALEGWTMQFKPLLESLQMLDLFEYMEDAAHLCGNYLASIKDENDRVKLFTKGYGLPASDVEYTDYTNYYNDQNPNKYLRKISESIKVVFDMANNGNGMEYIIPTPEGMQFLNYMYEMIKPFFGYSSYLDNMSYNKLTFDNFVYLFIACLTDTSLNPDDEQTDINIDEFFYSMPQFMSEYPQDILPLRAQYSVWWNNYRDQILEVDAPEPSISSTITDKEVVVLLAPRVRCWHKDTFTTALDNPGTGSVGVPLSKPYTGSADTSYPGDPRFANYLISKVNDIGNESTNNTFKGINSDMSNVAEVSFEGKTWRIPTSYLSGINSLVDTYDPSASGLGFSLFALDAARRAQKFLQRALIGGNRIQDFLYNHFEVKYLDARLRLPELLATSRELVQLTDVVNNTNIKSEDNTVAVAGDRAALAHAYDSNGGSYERYIEEHGYIISNLTVMPDVTYANVFNRDLAMLDQFDYPFPIFATLGMDAVYDIELAQMPIKVQSNVGELSITDNPQVFGYQGRYYNVKSKLGEEHGELLDTQDMYTFARDFNIYDPNKRPKLNYIFVHCHPVLDMFVVDNTMSDYFRYDIYFNSGANRPYPAHSLII